MNGKVVLPLFLLVSLIIAGSYGTTTSVASRGNGASGGQAQVGRGRVSSPIRGQVLEAGMPVTLNWTVDDLTDVQSQDLILSTDGGDSFNLKIAAYLPPVQHQLIWSTGAFNATGRGRLKVLLRLRVGAFAEVISDDFSILPAPRNPLAASMATAQVMKDGSLTNSIAPAFASPGPCVSAPLPTLNFNMTGTPPPSSLYRGEPSLAQDPTTPEHFHTGTGAFSQTASINTTAVQWGYTGTSTTQGLNFGGLVPNGDITTAIGLDGAVYIVSLARSVPGGTVNRIVIFRSKTQGATFEQGVAVPNVPDTFVDKPVVAVNPNDQETLVITFNTPNLNPATRVAICKKASTGSLSSGNQWGVVQPRNQFGIDLSVSANTHPLIDPVDATNYWLFIVQPNDIFSSQPPIQGYKVYQYQVAKGALTLSNAIQQRVLPAQVLVGNPQRLVGAPPWTNNPTCRAIEEAVRASQNCQFFPANIVRAAIDYCDPNAHRMYIPTLVNTTNNPDFPDGGLTSDLFVTVWQYTGTESTITKRILPDEKEKYVACALTDGHGRVWVNAYIIAAAPNNPGGTDNQRAQMGTIAINRLTGDPGSIAYMSLRLPQNTGGQIVFLGDYVYTEAAFYSNGGSRTAAPTYTDLLEFGLNAFWIKVSGWN
jgi:hypothetical protein